METALYLLIGLLLGAGLAFVLLHSQVMSLKKDALRDKERLEKLFSENAQLQTLAQVMKTEKDNAEEQLEKQAVRFREERVAMENSLQKQMDQQLLFIREQINATSEKILKERSEQLASSNTQQLSSILTPLNEHIRLMKDAVEKSDRVHADTMSRLDATIKSSIEQSKEVGERADKLARALTSENKVQGNFGEFRLRQLLEGMGLEEGLQFEEQKVMRDKEGRIVSDEDGHKLIPDVILHFPQKRDLIIDSKMSFKAFEDYCNADTEEGRQDALKRHIASVRQHVNELSNKNYSDFLPTDHERLDFVLMYMFSENALQLALSADPGIWRTAYDRKVIIVGSQNLFPMLRILEMSWNQVRQIENQREIMDTANQIIDRVQFFSERFEEVEKQLHKTQEAFNDVKLLCDEKGKSIQKAASNLLRYGGQQNTKRKKFLPSPDN